MRGGFSQSAPRRPQLSEFDPRLAAGACEPAPCSGLPHRARALLSESAMKLLIAPLSLVLCLAACSTSGLPNAGDGGAQEDGGLGGDLAGRTCSDLQAEIAAWLDSHTACASDGDCTRVGTACGLPWICGAYTNTSAAGPQLDALLAEWQASCATPCHVFCPALPSPQCRAGKCTAHVPEPVGAPCREQLDCASADCLVQVNATVYPDGYCSERCGPGSNATCPAGSVCRSDGNGGSSCYATCDPNAKKSDCRTGYSCCGLGGPSEAGAACVPPVLCGG